MIWFLLPVRALQVPVRVQEEAEAEAEEPHDGDGDGDVGRPSRFPSLH